MLRIRRIHDDVMPANRERLAQAQVLLRRSFEDLDEQEVAQLGRGLRNPFRKRFRKVVLVAIDGRKRLVGFAVVLHEPVLRFGYLDWIATSKELAAGGVGGALYGRVRAEARAVSAKGLFFECLPDDPQGCPDPTRRKQNARRLRFYEGYGARPVVGTDYETPLSAEDSEVPLLVYDPLETGRPLRRAFARKVVRAILERKYGHLCPAEYTERVIASFHDGPIAIREPRYGASEAALGPTADRSDEPIALVVNDRHEIHHVRERGYVESPARVGAIRRALLPSGAFEPVAPRKFPDKHVRAVHDAEYVRYLRRACERVGDNETLYPYVFPLRNKTRPPDDHTVLSGYYCIDTFTPIHRNAYPAARRAVDCALTAADEILDGRRLAYALVRPPGHHAERRSFGGFCYFNNSAIAANYLAAHGPVAILDIDYHHGNGQQEIFYRRADVLTVSIHGRPGFAYPYFAGFADETGEGPGQGFNLNLPLPERQDGKQYRKALGRALRRVEDHAPVFLVVALGLDTARLDPTGTWSLTAVDFHANGRLVGELGLPTLVVQEGGYRTRTLGANARRFFAGLGEGARRSGDRWARRPQRPPVRMRYEVTAPDREVVRSLVAATGFFTSAEVDVAVELVDTRLDKGPDSGYHFVFAERDGGVAGYTCYGPIPATECSFDLYWIAVSPPAQGEGLGRRLLEATERLIREQGGARVYVDTSSAASYGPTRAFYERCGYLIASLLDDFYAPGNGRVTYCKVL